MYQYYDWIAKVNQLSKNVEVLIIYQDLRITVSKHNVYGKRYLDSHHPGVEVESYWILVFFTVLYRLV